MFRRGTCLLLALAVAASSMPLSWSIADPSDPSNKTLAPVAHCSCCAQEACPCGCCDLPASADDPKPSATPCCVASEAPARVTTVIRCGCSPNRFFLLSLTFFLEPRTETKLPAPPSGVLEERRVSSASHFLPPDTPPPRAAA